MANQSRLLGLYRKVFTFGIFAQNPAPSSLGLYENLRQILYVETSHSINKSLITKTTQFIPKTFLQKSL